MVIPVTTGPEIPLTDEHAHPPELPTDPPEVTSESPGAPEESGSRSLGSLMRSAVDGAIWSTLSFIVGKVIVLVNTIVLARLLTPADFGLVSFAMILIGALTLLQDLGVPAALIYDRRGIEITAGTALSVNVLAALVFCVLAIGLAPLMSAMGNDSDLVWITIVLSGGLLISALGSVQGTIMMRELAFRRRTVPEIAAVVVEGVVSIALAMLGFGVWSLVIGYLCMAATSTTLLWVLSPLRLRPHLDIGVARDLLHYGKHVSFNSVLGFGANNIDYLIIGNLLGARILGLYTMAFTIATLPAVALTLIASRVIFPVVADIRDDTGKLSQTLIRAFTVVSTLAVVAFIITILAGPSLMAVLLGDRWDDIQTPLRLLAVYGVLRSIGTVFPPMYKVLGRPDIEWRLTLSKLVVVTLLLLAGVPFGIRGVAIGQIIGVFVFTPLAAVVYVRLMRAGTRNLLAAAGDQVIACGVASLVVVIWRVVSQRSIWSQPPAEAMLLAGVVMLAYGVCMAILNPHVVRNVVRGTPLWAMLRG